MRRHLGPVRFRGLPADGAEVLQAEGRKLLGSLIGQLRLAKIHVGKMERTLPDGTRMVAQYDGSLPIVTVFPPEPPPTPLEERKADVWVPRGFVLYPVSDLVPQGWGTPVVQVTLGGAGPYDAENLAPGLDVERWTPGGKLGEVLLTRAPDAGYPDAKRMEAPLLFHPKAGLRPSEPVSTASDAPWTAYRLEFTGFTADSPDATPAARGEMIAWKRAHFEIVNAHRASVDREPLLLPLRGVYDSAQATAEVMAATSVNGHYYQGFALTYRSVADRLDKDGGAVIATMAVSVTQSEVDDRNVPLGGGGGGGENLLASALSATTIGTDPDGNTIDSFVPGPPLSAQQAFDAWMASPGHQANIESALWDAGGLTHSSAAALNVGTKGAAYAEHFLARDAWIAAGNMTWQSDQPEVPLLSWYGFNSLSLGWETWPVQPTYYSTRSGSDFALTAAVTKVRGFTTRVPDVASPWLVYIDKPQIAADARERPAMAQFIFARGRVIALAPRGGLVWAAAIQKIASLPDLYVPGIDGTVYRLVALVHHADDHDGTDEIALGMTHTLRVWWCDLPDSQLLHANPQSVIRGVYGEEDDTWPWIEKNSPYSWRGGTTVDVAHGAGAAADMLKYASQWRFSPNGRHAACLRDFGTRADYEDHFVYDGRVKLGNAPNIVGTFTGPTTLYTPSGQFGHFIGGPNVVCVTLDLTPTASDIGISRNVSAPSAGASAHELRTTFVPSNGNTFGPLAWVRPCAVDYAADGTRIYAHHVWAWWGASHAVPSGGGAIFAPNLRQGVYFGAWDAAWPQAVTGTVWYSAVAASGSEDIFALPASVIDVRDRVFAACGRNSPLTDEGPNEAMPGYPEYPNYGDAGFDGGYRLGAFTAECVACANVPATYTVRMWRGPTRIIDRQVTNVGAVLYDLRLSPTCDFYGELSDPSGVPVEVTDPYFWWGVAPASTNLCLNACYQRRDGQWIASLLYVPQAGAMAFKPGADTFRCGTNQDFTTACLNDCGTTPKRGVTYTSVTPDAYVDGGGAMASSLGDGAALATLMQIPGGNPRTLYVRAV